MRTHRAPIAWTGMIFAFLASSGYLGAGDRRQAVADADGKSEWTEAQDLLGKVSPYAIGEVRPHTNGIVEQVLFTEGADISRGEALFQLDSSLYEKEFLAARARLECANANLSVAETNLVRSERLFLANQILDLDIKEIRAMTEKAKAEVAVATADLKLAEFNLERTRIFAPISGRIGKVLVSQGALITREQVDPLAIVLQIDPVCIEFEQPLGWFLNLQDRMRLGNLRESGDDNIEAALLLDDGQLYRSMGKPLFSQATINDASGTATFKVVFPNPDHTLLPGMAVTCLLSKKANDVR